MERLQIWEKERTACEASGGTQKKQINRQKRGRALFVFLSLSPFLSLRSVEILDGKLSARYWKIFSFSPPPSPCPPFFSFGLCGGAGAISPPHPPSLPVLPPPLLLKGNIFSVEFIAEGRLLFPTHSLSPSPTRKARSALFFSLVRAFSPDPPSPPSVGSLVREGISVASVPFPPSPSIPLPTSSQAYLFTRPRKEGGSPTAVLQPCGLYTVHFPTVPEKTW